MSSSDSVPQLAHHLLEVALDQRLDLGAVDGEVVVELGVGPDDRVDLADRAARVGLDDLDVGVVAVLGRADHECGRAVAEDHPRRADGADLVRELLGADDEHRALDLLEDPHGVGEAVGEARAGGDEVERAVGLEDPELPGEPGRDRRDQRRGACTSRRSPRRSPPACGRRPRARRSPPGARCARAGAPCSAARGSRSCPRCPARSSATSCRPRCARCPRWSRRARP